MNRPVPTSLLILLCFAGSYPVGACSRRIAAPSEAATKEPVLPTMALNAEPVRPEAVQAIFERNCKLCHGPDGSGIAAVAPDIRRAPQRSAEAWEQYLRSPKSLYPNSQMPSLEGASDEEIKAVAAYLADLTQHNPPPAQTEVKR
jgi:mono/diheme cytochrome c family protein